MAAARSLNQDIPVREMREDAVIRDLQDIRNRYDGVTHIRILDDLFLKDSHSIERAINIFNNFSFKWRAMAHIQTFQKVDEENLKHLHRQGCDELFIGVESGSPRVLKKIHKTSEIATIKDILRKIMIAGIGLKVYFVYGFPDETKTDFDRTYELALSLRDMASEYGTSFRTSVFQFRPYHGTEIYDELQSKYRSQNLLDNVTENRDLSMAIGRSEFNFESGNYSQEEAETINEYIKKTMDLKTRQG